MGRVLVRCGEGETEWLTGSSGSIPHATIMTTAERSRWRQSDGAPIARQIKESLANHPTLADPEIARLVGCNSSYVGSIRKPSVPYAPAANSPPTMEVVFHRAVGECICVRNDPCRGGGPLYAVLIRKLCWSGAWMFPTRCNTAA
nr:hypothetical protein Hi04_10k_c2220_00029 [uncultured bacterium]